MDRLNLYLYWVFTVGTVGVLLRAIVNLNQSTSGTIYSDAALAVLLFTIAVNFRYKWKENQVPTYVRYALTSIAAICLLTIVYFSV